MENILNSSMRSMEDEKDVAPDLGRSWKEMQIHQLIVTILNEGSTRARWQLAWMFIKTCFGVGLPGKQITECERFGTITYM